MQNRNKVLTILILLSLLFFSGCSTIKEKTDAVKQKFNKEEVVYITEEPIVCPKEIGENLDKVVYLFNGFETAFIDFIRSSSGYLYCQFTTLENSKISESIYSIKDYVSLKVILDETNTMDLCDVGCIPKVNSQYNYLYSKGVDLKTGNIHYTYCQNEKGLIISSKYFSEKENHKDYALYIESVGLSRIFRNNFDEVWEN